MRIGWMLSLSLVVGCGSSQFLSRQEPVKPFGGFGSVEIREFRNQAVGLPADAAAQAEAFVRTLPLRVREKLAKEGRFTAGAGPALVIEGYLSAFDPGSQMARYIIGFGAGSGEIRAEVYFRDTEGGLVADGTARGTVWGGFFGGTLGEAEDRVARAIVEHVGKHWEPRP